MAVSEIDKGQDVNGVLFKLPMDLTCRRPATPPRSPTPPPNPSSFSGGHSVKGFPLTDQHVIDYVCESPNVARISVKTFADAIDYHYSTPMPDLESVFPWTHGLHPRNLHQRAFLDPYRRFRDKSGMYFDNPRLNCETLAADPIFSPPKETFGLMVVKVGDEVNEFGTLVGSVAPAEFLCTIDDGHEEFEEDVSLTMSQAVDAALHPVELMHKATFDSPGATNSEIESQETVHNIDISALRSKAPDLHGDENDHADHSHGSNAGGTTINTGDDSNSTNLDNDNIYTAAHGGSNTNLSASSTFNSDHNASSYANNTNAKNRASSSSSNIISPFRPEFLVLDPVEGISLRNFQVQVAKWATISNILVYVPNPKDHELATEVSRTIAQAQANFRQQHPHISDCRTFICYAKIEDFLNTVPHVVSVPPRCMNYDEDEVRLKNWDSNFLFHERVEMSMMSAATLVGNSNVWLGNTVDFEVYIDSYMRRSSMSGNLGMSMSNNPNDLASRNWITFVECFEGPQLPPIQVLDQYIREALDCSLYHEQQKHRQNHHIHPHLRHYRERSSSVSSAGSTSADANAHDKTITPLSIQFPSSGSLPISELSERVVYTILSLCKLIYIRSKVPCNGAEAGVLIYCNDGYTETSLLALAYLVYSTGVPCSQAWLDLHLKYGRPFFCFNMDVLVMIALEKVLLEYSPAITGSKFELDSGAVQPKTEIQYGLKMSNQIPPWFAKLDGSLPSKILPHMYLGALTHAENPEMLIRLGIRRILSVGEVLNWMEYNHGSSEEDGKESNDNDNNNDNNNNDSNNNNNNEDDKPSQGVYVQPYPGISKVMYIDNILDDGVDALSESLASCLEFIDEGFRCNEATLVHCRVGVSRSATVCIAEVMKRLSVGLPRAYLFVRVRRLNVIIQPNLRFMYELVKWEERNRRTGEGWLREVDWPIFCREIAVMNKVYIG